MELSNATSASTKPEELKVFISGRASECEHCRQKLLPGRWITLVGEAGARCLSCADLDELVFLPPGNAALTRRARAYSDLSAVVLKWSRSRKRYERQGLLVQEPALVKAEEECLADEPLRERRRQRDAIRRADLDERYAGQFAARVRALYPACPRNRETVIAEHACLKSSGRVGRSASAKVLDEAAIHLAVRAHIRHHETNYEVLLGRGIQREQARNQVRAAIDQIAARWQAAP
jgi:hypothetical protein